MRKWFLNIFVRSPFERQLRNLLGFTPGNAQLYRTALSHRSIKEGNDQNNERLEFLGDAVLSSVVADYLFKRYPYKGSIINCHGLIELGDLKNKFLFLEERERK